MIYIISEENDVTTNYISEWILSRGKEYTRLNVEDYTPISYKLTSREEEANFYSLKINKNDKVYHRRGRLNLIPKDIQQQSLYRYLKMESDSVIKTLELRLKESINYTGSYLKENQNYKINNLEIAKKVGFEIPDTLVTCDKNILQDFFRSAKHIITKTINFPVKLNTNNLTYHSSSTFLVTQNHIDTLGAFFSPVLVQKLVAKLYELRIFVFNELFYAMAIFSQKNNRTKIDYRNYDKDLPNRCVPFKMPKVLRQRILDFMKLAKMNTGSIDIIVTPNNEYVFLEINPQGQFDWVSKNCNYYIEKDIANYLCNS